MTTGHAYLVEQKAADATGPQIVYGESEQTFEHLLLFRGLTGPDGVEPAVYRRLMVPPICGEPGDAEPSDQTYDATGVALNQHPARAFRKDNQIPLGTCKPIEDNQLCRMVGASDDPACHAISEAPSRVITEATGKAMMYRKAGHALPGFGLGFRNDDGTIGRDSSLVHRRPKRVRKLVEHGRYVDLGAQQAR